MQRQIRKGRRNANAEQEILCAEAEDLECREAATFLQEEKKPGK